MLENVVAKDATRRINQQPDKKPVNKQTNTSTRMSTRNIIEI